LLETAKLDGRDGDEGERGDGEVRRRGERRGIARARTFECFV